MLNINELKNWSKKSQSYLNSCNLTANWFLFTNPRLYPLKINSSNFALLKQFTSLNQWGFVIELSKCLMRFFRLLLLIFVNFNWAKKNSLLVEDNVRGIIISHRVFSDGNKFNCPYFGFLVDAFHKNNINVGMVFINHSDTSYKVDDLNCVGDFKFEISVFWLALCEFMSVIRYGLIDFKFSLFLLGGCFSNGLINSIRIALRVDEIINSNSRLKFVIHTLEGHAWEHSLLAHARRGNQDLNFVAFQQAPINITSRAVFDLLLKFVPPNHILCSGQYSADFLKRFAEESSISVIGSNRGLIRDPVKRFNRPLGNVLVVPEGMISEVRIFLAYIREVSDSSSKFNFLFTLHPTMGEIEFYKEVKRYGLMGCVKLAKQPLDEVAKDCHCVLFRGSTAVIEAVRNGCLPVFVQDRFETCVNLFKDSGFNSVLTNHGKELEHIISEVEVDFDQFFRSANFVFSPFNAKALFKLKIW